MAGRGPAPKPGHLRQRRNRASTRATLPSEAASVGREVPDLPERVGDWHPRVLEWWDAIWRSPMAAEYLEADKQDLYMLAELRQDFAQARTAAERNKLATEIRLQGQRFGLSPIDRRRLQWEVEKGESAQENAGKGSKEGRFDRDPRKTLKTI